MQVHIGVCAYVATLFVPSRPRRGVVSRSLGTRINTAKNIPAHSVYFIKGIFFFNLATCH